MDLAEKRRLAADPTTPAEVLAKLVREGDLGDQRLFLIALENPSLPFEVWSQHLRFARAWNNPAAALYVATGQANPADSVLIEHLRTRRNQVKQGWGNPFLPEAERLLKALLDARWTQSLNLDTARLLEAAIQGTRSLELRYVGAHLSLLLAETVPLNEKQQSVLGGVREVLARRKSPRTHVKSGGLPHPPHSDCLLVSEHTRAIVYGPHRVFSAGTSWTVPPNYQAALRLHELLGTTLDLSPVRQAFFEKYPTLWITEG